jgi:hypothetical protein
MKTTAAAEGARRATNSRFFFKERKKNGKISLKTRLFPGKKVLMMSHQSPY